MSKRYHFNYTLRSSEGWQRNGGRKISGYCLAHAAQKLRNAVSSKWANPVSVSIWQAFREDGETWVELNLDQILELETA